MARGARVARLRWRCRRGMKELDALLTAYLDARSEALGAEEAGELEALLECLDQDIYEWLLGRRPPPSPLVRVVAAVRAEAGGAE